MARAATGSRQGVEWWTTKKRGRRYRWVINSAELGRHRSDPFDNFDDAKAARAKALAELSAKQPASTKAKRPLSEAWAEFIEGAEAGTITKRAGRSPDPYTPATLRGYRLGWEHVKDSLGPHPIGDIATSDIQAMIGRWHKKGATRSTINNRLDCLRAIYAREIRQGNVSLSPLTNIELPHTGKSRDIEIVSKEVAAELIAALPETEQAVWATAFYAGLRRGELQGLHVKDVDLKTRIIHVRHGWDQEEGLQAPKSKSGVRKVPIVDLLLPFLKAQIERTARSGPDLVFGRELDKAFVPSTIRSRAIKAWEDEELTPTQLHTCRHTFASLMIDAGCNAKALSVVMGHASITITFDTYGHLMPGGEDEVRDRLNIYLNATAEPQDAEDAAEDGDED